MAEDSCNTVAHGGSVDDLQITGRWKSLKVAMGKLQNNTEAQVKRSRYVFDSDAPAPGQGAADSMELLVSNQPHQQGMDA